MSSATHHASLDESIYQWNQSDNDCSLLRRRPLAGESHWLSQPREFREMFLSGNLTFSFPVTLSHLRSATGEFWRRLRFNHPEMAVETENGKSSYRFLQYRVLNDDTEVIEWVNRTLCVESGLQLSDFGTLRKSIVTWKTESNNVDKAVLLLHEQTESNSHGDITHLGFILNMNHQVTDGIGIRILLGNTSPYLPPLFKVSDGTSMETIIGKLICRKVH
jgi:hypothetical protein